MSCAFCILGEFLGEFSYLDFREGYLDTSYSLSDDQLRTLRKELGR